MKIPPYYVNKEVFIMRRHRNKYVRYKRLYLRNDCHNYYETVVLTIYLTKRYKKIIQRHLDNRKESRCGEKEKIDERGE